MNIMQLYLTAIDPVAIKILSEYDQKIPESQTADKPVAP